MKNNWKTADALLALRVIVGWTYFSALWRRLVLADKLSAELPGYLGVKFNAFLPNALWIQPAIEFFVRNPELLWWKLVFFTLVEGVVGLGLMVGFLTPLMGLLTAFLAFGILLGAGWLGTTCLDEWQIGILGMGAGIAFFFAGGGTCSLDAWLSSRRLKISSWTGFLPDSRYFLIPTAFAVLMALGTNQVFHGGLWGPLHNLSIKPRIEIRKAVLDEGLLRLKLMRVEGPDVYGSFLIGIRILENGEELWSMSGGELAALPEDSIQNEYVAKIHPGSHSLILPLGALAELSLKTGLKNRGHYEVELLDISGAVFRADVSPVEE